VLQKHYAPSTRPGQVCVRYLAGEYKGRRVQVRQVRARGAIAAVLDVCGYPAVAFMMRRWGERSPERRHDVLMVVAEPMPAVTRRALIVLVTPRFAPFDVARLRLRASTPVQRARLAAMRQCALNTARESRVGAPVPWSGCFVGVKFAMVLHVDILNHAIIPWFPQRAVLVVGFGCPR